MHCNQTPATLNMMQAVFKDLYQMDKIDALTQNGTPKQRGKRIQPNDIIRRTRQLMFSYPG